jgi:DNA-directed RNA polymerase specialized sigma24 family protein
MDNFRRTGKQERLTSARFENLLRRLNPERECAGVAYEDLRWRLRRFFEWNCRSEAEDLVDETFDRVAQKLDEQEILDVIAFAWGIAWKVRLEANKRAARIVAIPDEHKDRQSSMELRDTEEKVHAKIDQGRQLRCLQMCLQPLSENDRKLFVGYYRLVDNPVEVRQRLATSLGLTMNALRVRVNRVRDRVERCVDRCAASAAKARQRS